MLGDWMLFTYLFSFDLYILLLPVPSGLHGNFYYIELYRGNKRRDTRCEAAIFGSNYIFTIKSVLDFSPNSSLCFLLQLIEQ